MEQLGSQWTDLHEIWYLNILRKYVVKNSSFYSNLTRISGALHADLCTFMMVAYLAHVFLEWEMFLTKVVQIIKIHILCSIMCFFLNRVVCEIMWKNMVHSNRTTGDNIIRGIPFPCWITKAKRSHPEYAILPTFPRRQWIRGTSQCYVGYTFTLTYSFVMCKVKVKCEVHPRTSHEGQEGE